MERISAAEVLFSKTHQRLLRALFAGPPHQDGLPYAELLRVTQAGTGGIHRELQRFVRAGLVRERRLGARRFYLANEAHPVYEELRAVARKLLGIPAILKEALEPFAAEIERAFIFGSIAKNAEDAHSDVDVMIVGVCPMAPVLDALQNLEPRLGRKINPRFFDPPEYRRRLESDAFLHRVQSGPRIDLVGSTGVETAGPAQKESRNKRLRR